MQEKDVINWTTDQIILQRWLASPKKERKPKTIGLLASELGVDEATLWRWRQIPGFDKEVKRIIHDCVKDDLADIYLSLRREAKAGSYQHIKLVLEMLGDYVPKLAPTTPDGTQPYDNGPTDEERISRLTAIFNAARARRDGQAFGDGPDVVATIAGATE